MPNYDYYCSRFGHEFEVFHGMTQSPELSCENCQHSGLKRRVGTGAGILFTGDGFYETDYKRKPVASASSKEGSTEKNSATDSSKSSLSKN